MPSNEVDVREIAKGKPFECAGKTFTVMSGEALTERNVRRSSRSLAAKALAWLQNRTVVQSLDPDTIFGSMKRYLKGLGTPCVHDNFVPWVRDAFASNPQDFLFLVVEHANKTQEIVGYLWADCQEDVYPDAMYIRHVIVSTFEGNRLGSLLLRVQEFKISESDVAMLNSKLDKVHSAGLVKQISTKFDDFFATIGARDSPEDNRDSEASTPTNTPDTQTSSGTGKRRALETVRALDGTCRRVTRSMRGTP